MSHVTKAVQTIRLAALEVGGVNKLAERIGMNVDTARRLVGQTPPQAISNLEALENAAVIVLGDKAP